jgi:hypothetical protein
MDDIPVRDNNREPLNVRMADHPFPIGCAANEPKTKVR